MFARLKFTLFVPLALADTLYEPAVPLAVKVEEVACPFAAVVATHCEVGVLLVQPEDANVPLAPLSGPANVTDTPEAALSNASLTEATSGLANADVTAADSPSQR